MKRNAHALVMMSPMGKMPSVVPGSTKTAFLAAEATAAAAAAVVLPVIESWKRPLTKEASADDNIVFRTDPSAMLPERVIIGVNIACCIVLRLESVSQSREV